MPSRPVRFDNTACLNRSGGDYKFNCIMSFEIFCGLLETSSRSTAIEVLGTPGLNSSYKQMCSPYDDQPFAEYKKKLK